MNVVHAEDATGIERVSDLIHDQLMRAGDITYEKDQRLFRVPFAYGDRESASLQKRSVLRTTWTVALRRGEILIHNVENYHIEDPSHIVEYELDKIIWERDTSELRLTTCQDLEIELRVGNLDVEAMVSNTVIGSRTFTRFLGIIEFAGNVALFDTSGVRQM